jgi:hypothetical protein
MNAQDSLQFLNSISVMKNVTGSVAVATPNGIVLVQQPGYRYELAKTPEEVADLLRMSNIRELLRKRLVSLVY